MNETRAARPAEQPPTDGRTFDADRLLFLSDGVIAIAITLLVLEIHVPDVEHGLWDALVDTWPSFLSYALSFAVIGIMWAQHHMLFRHIRRADHLFLLINVLFLMWLAFVPFPTALLGEYLQNDDERGTAMAFYAGTFVVGALLFNLVWRYAAYHGRLLGSEADRRVVQRVSRDYMVGPLLYLADFGLAFVSATASLILFLLIAVFFAVGPLVWRDEGA